MKIIQIIPAERGWHVITYHLQTNYRLEITCWGLTDLGITVPMVAEENRIAPASEIVGEEFSIYSPAESWKYGITLIDEDEAGTELDKPKISGGDAELVLVFKNVAVWRWVWAPSS